MTRPIAAQRVAPEYVPMAGTAGESAGHPSAGAADAPTSAEFRSALATALGARPAETGRDGATSTKRARGGRSANESSDGAQERAQESAGRAGGTHSDLRSTSGDASHGRASTLAPDVRETFIGMLQGNLEHGDEPDGGIVAAARGETSRGDESAADAAVVHEFVASSLEIATAPVDASPELPAVPPTSIALPGSVEAAGVPGTASVDVISEAAGRRDPMSVRRDLAALAPEFRGRLERIIERMESEYGYTVEVVETTRSQERQDALFAQGRSRPGPIVTWTRASNHGEGRAADVVIDGSYGNAPAYARLAQVAREEGLRTLGPRDPGHVELPAGASAKGDGAVVTRAFVPEVVAAPAKPSVVAAPAKPSVVAAPPAAAIPRLARSAVDPRVAGVATDVNAGSRMAAADADLRALVAERSALPVTGRRVAGEPLMTESAMPAGQVARANQVAGVAQVAAVATIASVATVARVATVGDARRTEGAKGTGGDAPTLAQVLTGIDVPVRERVVSARAQAGEHQSSGNRREREQPEAVLSAFTAHEGGEDVRALLSRELPRIELGDSLSAAPVAGLSRSDATERIARVLRMQEAAGDRPLSSVLLRLDNPEGGEDRIRIDLRGNAVGATLDMSDPRTAEQLRSHASELQQSLQRQGLDGEPMVFRSASRITDSAAYSLSAGAAERDMTRAASATASDGGGFTAKDSRNQPHAHERDGTDQQRSRQRRDGKGEQK